MHEAKLHATLHNRWLQQETSTDTINSCSKDNVNSCADNPNTWSQQTDWKDKRNNWSQQIILTTVSNWSSHKVLAGDTLNRAHSHLNLTANITTWSQQIISTLGSTDNLNSWAQHIISTYNLNTWFQKLFSTSKAGGESNREIVSFRFVRACERARGLVA